MSEPSNVPAVSGAREAAYAEAIRDRIKALTPPPPVIGTGGGLSLGATEWDIARAAIAVADAEQAELRAEVERLRAGESTEPAPENAVPTPAQWLRRFNDAEPTARLAAAERAIASSEAVARSVHLAMRQGDLRSRAEAAEAHAAELEAALLTSRAAHQQAVEDADRLRGAVSIADMARRFSLWLNSTYPSDVSQEAVHWRRVLKVCEEAGEVRAALGAYLHENPRKPQGSLDDVISELADCVGAALGAIEHLTGHERRSLAIAAERVRFVCERVGVVAGAPAPPPSEGASHV